jgi:hypothetical protein
MKRLNKHYFCNGVYQKGVSVALTREKFLQFDTSVAARWGKPSSEYLRLLLFIFPCLMTYNVERMPDRISAVEL